jgi:hypothetical protein
MKRIEHKITIGPSIEVVFDFITEPGKGPIVIGSEFVETMNSSAARSK